MCLFEKFPYYAIKMHDKYTQTGKNLGSLGKLVKNKKIYQRGYNRNYYIRRSQRGLGFGAVFSGLSRFLIPLIKSGYNALKSEALSAGGDILKELNVENIVKQRGKKAVQNLKTKAVDKIDSIMTGSGSTKARKTIKRQRNIRKVHMFPKLDRTRRTKIKNNNNLKISTKHKRKRKTQKILIKDFLVKYEV